MTHLEDAVAHVRRLHQRDTPTKAPRIRHGGKPAAQVTFAAVHRRNDLSGFVRGQGRESAIAVGQRPRRQRRLVRQNVRARVQAHRHDAERQAHTVARAHPHAVQGAHTLRQQVRAMTDPPSHGLVPRGGGRKAETSQIPSTRQGVGADTERAAQIVTAPARHGREDGTGLVAPARDRTQVAVPAEGRHDRVGGYLAGESRRVVPGRRQANSDLPAAAAQNPHNARPQAHAAPARRHRRDQQQNAATHSPPGHVLRRPGNARAHPACGACA